MTALPAAVRAHLTPTPAAGVTAAVPDTTTDTTDTVIGAAGVGEPLRSGRALLLVLGLYGAMFAAGVVGPHTARAWPAVWTVGIAIAAQALAAGAKALVDSVVTETAAITGNADTPGPPPVSCGP